MRGICGPRWVCRRGRWRRESMGRSAGRRRGGAEATCDEAMEGLVLVVVVVAAEGRRGEALRTGRRAVVVLSHHVGWIWELGWGFGAGGGREGGAEDANRTRPQGRSHGCCGGGAAGLGGHPH
jgi:hypothetical protein